MPISCKKLISQYFGLKNYGSFSEEVNELKFFSVLKRAYNYVFEFQATVETFFHI